MLKIFSKKNKSKATADQSEDHGKAEDWRGLIAHHGDRATPDMWYGLSQALCKQDDFEEAEKITKKGLLKFPNDLRLKLQSADIDTLKKDWPKALSHWRKIYKELVSAKDVREDVLSNIRFNISLLNRIVNIDEYKKRIKAHDGLKPGHRKIAIYTSFTKGYDELLPPEIIDERFDYIVYTDHRPDDFGIYDIRPLPYPDYDNPRAIRYPKTHPHELLKEYETAVWLDANFMIVGDIYPLISKFMNSGKAIGSSDHPLRKSIYEEFQECVKRQKDDYKTMKRQMDFYRSVGFDTDDLSENGFLMFDLKSPGSVDKLTAAMDTWWNQITKFSVRDQLSFNYAISTNNVERFHLIEAPLHIRIHPAIVRVPHHTQLPLVSEFKKMLDA